LHPTLSWFRCRPSGERSTLKSFPADAQITEGLEEEMEDYGAWEQQVAASGGDAGGEDVDAGPVGTGVQGCLDYVGVEVNVARPWPLRRNSATA
jgi:hypothetical protein